MLIRLPIFPLVPEKFHCKIVKLDNGIHFNESQAGTLQESYFEFHKSPTHFLTNFSLNLINLETA